MKLGMAPLALSEAIRVEILISEYIKVSRHILFAIITVIAFSAPDDVVRLVTRD